MKQNSYFQLERDSGAIAQLINTKPSPDLLHRGIALSFLGFVEREGILPLSQKEVDPPTINLLWACFREWGVMVSLPLIYWSNSWAMVLSSLGDRVVPDKKEVDLDPLHYTIT